MDVQTRWDLPAQIIALSDSDNWGEAVKEWGLVDIEILDPGEFDECLCGHKPIRELCHISNNENGNTAIVGNHCIEKFNRDNPDEEVFGTVPRAMGAAKRILGDLGASANKDLIDISENMGVLSAKDAGFYRDVWRKRNLSEKQESYKQNLNRKILYQVILSVRAAYQRLKNNIEQGTAGPKLVDYAFKENVLKDRDKDFYMQKWMTDWGRLTDGQQKYRAGLNRMIIQQLKDKLDT